MTNYQDFCKTCIQGKIGFKPDFYIIEKIHKDNTDIPKENVDITIVSPTKAAVEQAKSELKQENGINRDEKIHIFKVEARVRSNVLKREKIRIKLKEHLRVSIKKQKIKRTYKSLWM